MKPIIRIKPKFVKKTRKGKSNEQINYEKLNEKLTNIIQDLDFLIKNEDKLEIPFEIFHVAKVPPKTGRIKQNLLKYLKWSNKGSVYENNRIILLCVAKKENLREQKFLFEKILFLKENSMEITKENLEKNNILINREHLHELLVFLSNYYQKINSYTGPFLDENKIYVCDILCNDFLFKNSKNKINNKILIEKNNFENSHLQYLHNPVVNEKLFFDKFITDDFIQKKTEMPDANNKTVIGILDGNGSANKNCIVKRYIEPDKVDNFVNHGSNVASIAIMGDKLNNFNDGCGVFKTILCVVAYSGINSIEFIDNIKKAIKDNPDVKIWNISMGQNIIDINPFIRTSLIGQELDKISVEENVIFIVSGGNDKSCSRNRYLSPPGDSLTSITVNALDGFNKSASYSRKGTSFLNFNSPTCSIFGGDINKKIIVLKEGLEKEFSSRNKFCSSINN